MTPQMRAMLNFEVQSHLRSFSLWTSVTVISALLVFNANDSWELTSAHLLIKLTAGIVPFLFLLSGFITLNGTSREEGNGFADVFCSLPPTNGMVYGSKLAAAMITLTSFIAPVLSLVLLAGPMKNEFGSQYCLVAGVVLLETVLAISAGIAAAMLVTAFVPNNRTRYVSILLWLIGSIMAVGISLSFGYYELLSLAPLTIGDEPYFFSLGMGFFPFLPGIIRHIVTQAVLIWFLLTIARFAYHTWREKPSRPLSNAVWATFICLCLVATWNAISWQQQRSEITAEVTYATGTKGISAQTDWYSLGSGSALLPKANELPTYRVSRYDIDVSFANPRLGLQADAIMQLEQVNQPKVFITLHRSLRITSVEWFVPTPTVTTASAVANLAATRLSGVWQPAHWQRAGNFISVQIHKPKVLPALLRVKYVGKIDGVWLGARGYDKVQFVTSSGTYLSALLGWYPLVGGWQLPPSQVVIQDGRYQPVDTTTSELASGNDMRTRLLTSEFTVRVQPVPGQWVVTNLPKNNNEFLGQADGVSLFAASLVEKQGNGLVIAAPPQSLQGIDAVFELYGQLAHFYNNVLGLKLPPVRIATVPGWLDRVFARNRAVHFKDYVETSPMLGDATAWREDELAIAIRDAKRWMTKEKMQRNLGSATPRVLATYPHLLRAATNQLNMAAQRQLWSTAAGHGDYLLNPVLAGASRYLALLWDEYAEGPSGKAYYQHVLEAYQRDLTTSTNEQRSGQVVVMEREHRMAEVFLRLHAERERAGMPGVVAMLRKLLTLSTQGNIDWNTWEILANE